MALLNKLKSLLGLDDGQPEGDRQRTDDVGVTVEHEPDADEEAPPATPAPGTEAADPEPADERASESEGESEPDQEASSGPTIDPEVDAPPADDSEPAEEPDERSTVGSETEPIPTEEPELEPEPEPETPEDGAPIESEADSDPTTGSGITDADEEPVREIRGIGPSYATKLSEAGVDSASDLAAADATELSVATGLSEKRVQGWIDRAQAR